MSGWNKWKQMPITSGTLVAANVIVYVICMLTGNLLYSRGILDVWHVVGQKEYGRILWAAFLHSGTNHIVNNMLILFLLGAMIEKEIGHIRFGLIYFMSAIGGNLLSLLSKIMTNDLSGSLGASGAVFGLDGLLLSMVLFSRRRMENVTPIRVVLMIVYSLYSGFTGQNIDNAAHVGGLLTGFVGGTVMCIIEERKRNKAREV